MSVERSTTLVEDDAALTQSDIITRSFFGGIITIYNSPLLKGKTDLPSYIKEQYTLCTNYEAWLRLLVCVCSSNILLSALVDFVSLSQVCYTYMVLHSISLRNSLVLMSWSTYGA